MSGITLRPATIRDSSILLSWANGAESIKWKQNTHNKISSADHENWLKARLSDKETALWIVMSSDKPVGQVRLEKKRGAVHVDIYLIRANRGKGYASAALTNAIESYSASFGPQQFYAIIHRDNVASQKLFAKHCFKVVDRQNSEWLHFIRVFP